MGGGGFGTTLAHCRADCVKKRVKKWKREAPRGGTHAKLNSAAQNKSEEK